MGILPTSALLFYPVAFLYSDGLRPSSDGLQPTSVSFYFSILELSNVNVPRFLFALPPALAIRLDGYTLSQTWARKGSFWFVNLQ